MLTRKELYNIPGWHTRRHLVVIESDDWGSIRTPSREVYDELLRRGIRVDRDPYCRFDRLESKDDLSRLFDVLLSVKDCHGNPAVITANTVTANPVFDKIEASQFQHYFYEPFPETYRRDASFHGTEEAWHEGMDARVFHPQFHGREHLNVRKWLRVLRQGDSTTMTAFRLGTFGITQLADPTIKEYYMGAFNSGLDEDIAYYNSLLKEGLDMFEHLFGFRSESFIATTYEWSPKIEPCLVENGVKYIQGTVCQKIPIDDDTTVRQVRRSFQGTRAKSGLVHLMRNCYFEPSTKPHFDFVDDCLHRIELAFRWGKAANICSHRVNYIGAIHPENS
ncbi:MAG: hypothetical protein J5641_00965, partial [Bacteroidales bacterium]|nr:hypothetical protein [Bacteroidales bacterium]